MFECNRVKHGNAKGQENSTSGKWTKVKIKINVTIYVRNICLLQYNMLKEIVFNLPSGRKMQLTSREFGTSGLWMERFKGAKTSWTSQKGVIFCSTPKKITKGASIKNEKWNNWIEPLGLELPNGHTVHIDPKIIFLK